MKEKNIRELAKRMGLITVENMRKYTIPQLVVMVANKVNELIVEVGRFESDVVEDVKTQNENIKQLLDKGLIGDVTKIFNKWVEDGTFDVLINQTALKKINNRIDETNAQLSDLENVDVIFSSRYGLIGDYNVETGIGTDNTQAFRELIQECIKGKRKLSIPAGNYLITDTIEIEQYSGLIIEGTGTNNTIIYSNATNKPILKLIGSSYNIKDLGLSYTTQQLATNKGSIGIALIRVYNSQFNNMQISMSNTGIGQLKEGAEYWQFSNTFDNIIIQSFTYRGINMEGVGNTGSSYNNIYINNQKQRGDEELLTAEIGFFISGTSESSLNQVNIEWGNLECCFKFEDCGGGINCRSLHIEGVNMIGNTGVFSVVRCQGLSIDGVDMLTIECNGSWKQEIFYLEGICKGNVENINLRSISNNGKNIYRFYSDSVREDSVITCGNFIFPSGLLVKDRLSNGTIILTKNPIRTYLGRPKNGLAKKTDIYYNQNPETDSYVGYVCVRDGHIGSIRKKKAYYDAGDFIVLINDNGHCYKARTSGVTASTDDLVFDIRPSSITLDGDVEWQEVGTSCLFRPFGKIE